MLKRCQRKHRLEPKKFSWKRIEQFDLERAAEVQRLEESQTRLEDIGAIISSCQLHHRSEPTQQIAGTSRTIGLSISKPEEGGPRLEWLADRTGSHEHGVDGCESCGITNATGSLCPTW